MMDGSLDRPIVYFDDNGNGPHHHVCMGGAYRDRVKDWLERQTTLGQISPEGRATVERLLDEA